MAATTLDTALLSSIGDISLVARSLVEGFLSGLHRSPFLGYSSEFASYRPYMQGDNLKHVDWKVWGRTDELYVKQFEDDTNLNGLILLDSSGSMDFGEPNKFHYARMLAAAIAYLMSLQHDAPGLTLFGGAEAPSISSSGRRNQIDDLFAILASATARGETIAAPALLAQLEALNRRGIAVVISDLFSRGESLLEVLRMLRVQRQEVLLFHVVSKEEDEFGYSGDFLMEDSETGELVPVQAGPFREEYRRRFKSFCDEMTRNCDRMEIEYRRIRTDEPLEKALTLYFEQRMAK